MYGFKWSPVFAQIDLKKCTIKIKDGTTPTANELEITIGEGNLTYTERVNREYTLDRGTLDEVRDGDEVPCELKMDFTWDYISSRSGGTATIEDALKQLNEASGWVTSDTDTCRPYAVDVEVVYEPTPSSCGDKETILFSDFRYEELGHDLREGTISCSGRCNVTKPTVTRAAQS